MIVGARRPDAAQAGRPAAAASWCSARSPASIDLAEDRERWNALCARLEIPQPAGGTAATVDEALGDRRPHRLPGARAARATCSAAGPWRSSTTTRACAAAMAELAGFGSLGPRGRAVGRAPGADRPLPRGRHRGRRRRHPRRHRRGRSSAGSWSTSRRPACTRATSACVIPPPTLSRRDDRGHRGLHPRASPTRSTCAASSTCSTR